ncbi:glycosyltransferase [Candidatus Woesebacteria bacterium]|nr:glycosyltransferase [Candidatus Woesebacteria bacterium]
MLSNRQLKVALVYDKVSLKHGGAERVIQALSELYPHAQLFTAVADQQTAEWSRAITINPSFLQKFGWLPNSYRLLVPFFPLGFESFAFDAFELVISVTSGEAKGILTKPGQLHICYLLTPPRYLYSHVQQHLQYGLAKLPVIHQIIGVIIRYLRWWDTAAAHRPDYVIPISEMISHRCKQYYNRVTEPVIYPPTTTLPATMQALPMSGFFLSVSRLVPYKRVDLSIKACLQTGDKLIVTSDGIEKDSLTQLAVEQSCTRHPSETLVTFLKRAQAIGARILFTSQVTDGELSALYSHCGGLLMPGIEDFGIAAMEAASFGKASLLHTQTGAAELLTDPQHSVHLTSLTLDAMIKSVQRFKTTSFNQRKLKKVAKENNMQAFKSEFSTTIAALWERSQKEREFHVVS